MHALLLSQSWRMFGPSLLWESCGFPGSKTHKIMWAHASTELYFIWMSVHFRFPAIHQSFIWGVLTSVWLLGFCDSVSIPVCLEFRMLVIFFCFNQLSNESKKSHCISIFSSFFFFPWCKVRMNTSYLFIYRSWNQVLGFFPLDIGQMKFSVFHDDIWKMYFECYLCGCVSFFKIVLLFLNPRFYFILLSQNGSD